MNRNSREYLRRKGGDFAYYPKGDRFNHAELNSVKRPYVVPKEEEGSKAAKNRGKTT